MVLSPTSDGAFTLSLDPNITSLSDTELALASKDVLLILTHGVCVVNGAAATMIKCGI